MFSLCLFVCLFVSRITQKLIARFLQKHPLDLGSNADHVTLALGLWLGSVVVAPDIPCHPRGRTVLRFCEV